MRGGKKTKLHKKKGLPAMISFSKGMAMLPDRLAHQLREKGVLRTSCTVTRLEETTEGWRNNFV